MMSNTLPNFPYLNLKTFLWNKLRYPYFIEAFET
jgi:hypothetical protein